MPSIILPFSRWAPDDALFGGTGLRLARNAVWRGGRYRGVPDTTRDAGATVGDPVPGVASLPANGELRNFFGTTTNLHYFDGFSVPTNLGGVASVGATHWSWTLYGSSVIAADVANPIKVSTNLGAVANLITSVLTPRARYLATIKQHVFGAYVDDGAGGAFDGTKFWWSARNAAANWQPGVDRAGFAYIRAGVGNITGVVGFEDFGLLFCERGVFRIDYIGGDVVWALRQIAGAADGLPQTAEDSLSVQGFDVFYMALGGPRTVRAGEQVIDIGEGSVSAYLTQVGRPSDVVIQGFRVYGGAMLATPYVVFHYGGGPVNQPQNRLLVYNAAEQAWSTVTSPVGQAETMMGFAQIDGPGSFMIAAVSRSLLNTVARDRYQGALTQTTTFRTPRMQPAPGRKSRLVAVRPIWSGVNSGTGGALGDSNVRISVSVYTSDKPHFEGIAAPLVLQNVAGTMDPHGYLLSSLPLEAQMFQFDVEFDPLLAASAVIYEDLAGLEVVTTPGTALY